MHNNHAKDAEAFVQMKTTPPEEDVTEVLADILIVADVGRQARRGG